MPRVGYKDLPEMVLEAATDDADIIIIALGTNDDNGGNMAAIRATMATGIDDLRVSNSRATIYWLNILPRFDGPPYEDKSILRPAIAAECAVKGVTCWDTFTDPWVTQAQLPDNLHPNASGHAAIAARVLALLP